MERATRKLLDTVRRTIRQHDLWRAGDGVLLACSGGTDSTAAALIVADLRPSLGHDLALAHVDHGLRAESAEEGAAVRRLADRLGARFIGCRVELANGPNLQGRARTARYGALLDAMREQGFAVLATAHHADDQAETLLMRAARGAGLAALVGIRRCSGHVVRPLLDVQRSQLRAYLEQSGVSWLEDPSNASHRFARNAIRHRVMPALETVMPGAAAGLARTSAHLNDHHQALAHWLNVAMDAVDGDAPGRVHARRSWLDNAPPAAVSAWLHAAAVRLGLPPPSARAAQQFCAFLASRPVDGNPCEVAGMRLTVRADEVLAERADIARGVCAD